MIAANKRSLLAGVMITAGCAIGAGMFSLPVVASGMWFSLSLVCLVILWYLNYLAASYYLEINSYFSPGASFNTITKSVLGKEWNILINILVAFLLYILLYAYYSAFGSIAQEYLGTALFTENTWAKGGASLLIGAVLAFIVWVSTSAVGYMSTVLVVGMVAAFIVSMAGYATQVQSTNLWNIGPEDNGYVKYIWAALPYFMTTFGFVTVVPSLYKFYGKNTAIIKRSLLLGSFIALLVYTFFLFVTFGNISRQSFVEINASGGNIGQLLAAFGEEGHSSIQFALSLFSNFAILSSFLGVGIGLFDFIADKFAFRNDKIGRLKAALIAFVPAGVASFFFPNGFIFAIGFAGLVFVLSFFIVPYFMLRKLRQEHVNPGHTVAGGSGLLNIYFLMGLLIVTCQVLSMLGYLPKW